jgi:ABC-type cobalamin/Fe3+-siderophores transport system ATPase subunit
MKSDYEIARRTRRATCRVGSNNGWSSRVLVGDPGALLADEPTGSLDFRTGEMIMGLLEDLHRSRRLTSNRVTHNLNFARQADSGRAFIRFFF